MFVIKRDGTRQAMMFDKITERIQKLCDGLAGEYVDPVLITQKVVNGVYNGMSTVEIDTLAAETAAYMTSTHPDFEILAARISISNLHKCTCDRFSDTVTKLYDNVDSGTGKHSPLVSNELRDVVMHNRELVDGAIDYSLDFEYRYFGFRTLQQSYLLKVNGSAVERPQDMLMRVSLGIHGENVQDAIETYRMMSRGWFTHASPTMFNSGTPRAQMSSCFLLSIVNDSIDGIYETLKRCALVSKYAGGVGLCVSGIRCKGSSISGTGGSSNGIVPMLRVFSDTSRYVDQGGGKRKGAFAVYLEPWHADVFDFLELKKNHGKEEMRARDLFYALWINDLFMRRVESDAQWTLFCPNEAPGLVDAWGAEFDELYEKYEQMGRGRQTVRAQQLWFAILESQIETGTPYMLHKDACNRKSNQRNLGTIRCSNLCTEIVEYTDKDEGAVCNLASIALPMFVDVDRMTFDHEQLYRVTRTITANLNRIIDRNFYPIDQARASNLRHRPIGIGVQGLADVFIKLRMSFESESARTLNREIFETIYFAALDESCYLAERLGPYESYAGSPMSEGKLQMDLWEDESVARGDDPPLHVVLSTRHDWAGLRQRIRKYGVRNSLLVAPMPTANTSQILGNNECFEPYTSNIYTRRVLSGEFTVINRHLVNEAISLGVWNQHFKDLLIANNGSVQSMVDVLPADVRDRFKTVWEIKQKSMIDMAADRAPFIDQSQSMNLFIAEPNFSKLSSMHFHAWKRGLKTGMYYLRTKSATDAIKFTIDKSILDKADSNRCDDVCNSCSA